MNNEKEPIYKKGEIVIYQNGDRYELGEVKEVCKNENGTYDYRVWYHMGDTSARTPSRCLHKISNLYAFSIKRKRVDNDE